MSESRRMASIFSLTVSTTAVAGAATLSEVAEPPFSPSVGLVLQAGRASTASKPRVAANAPEETFNNTDEVGTKRAIVASKVRLSGRGSVARN